MQENDDKKGASIAIENLKKLLEFHQISLERWENSEYCYTDVGREMLAKARSCKEDENERE